MSTFTKKMIQVDANLSKLIGVGEGQLVSYSEITKAIYEYIKRNHLRKEPLKRGREKFCFNCGVKLKINVSYCDNCGRKLG